MLKPFSTKLDEKTLARLEELSEKTQIPKSRLCKQAIELLLSYHEKREKDLAYGEQMRKEEERAHSS